MQELAKRLDCPNHSRHHVVATEQPLDFGLDAVPGASGELTQQPPVEPRVQPQPFRDGKHHLPVRNRKTNLLGYMDRRQ